MTTATRLPTDMGGWCPVSRHYAVDGGYIVVTKNMFLTAEGTDIFYADEHGGAISLQPIIQYPEGTSHNDALTQLGYTVVDTIGDEPEPEPEEQVKIVQQSVIELLPPQIAQMVSQALEAQ